MLILQRPLQKDLKQWLLNPFLCSSILRLEKQVQYHNRERRPSSLVNVAAFMQPVISPRMLPHYSPSSPSPKGPKRPPVSGVFRWTPGYTDSVSHTTETTVTDGGFKYYEVTKHQKSKDTNLQRGVCSSPCPHKREISTQGPGTFQMYDEKALGKNFGFRDLL